MPEVYPGDRVHQDRKLELVSPLRHGLEMSSKRKERLGSFAHVSFGASIFQASGALATDGANFGRHARAVHPRARSPVPAHAWRAN